MPFGIMTANNHQYLAVCNILDLYKHYFSMKNLQMSRLIPYFANKENA
jgi:hypothetical protein